MATHAGKLGAASGDSFLDVGCGTGALVAVLREAGFRVHGVDAAPNMVRIAAGSGLTCTLADIAAGLPFADASFDFVIASFVAHGLRLTLRTKLYREARRVARKSVIMHDYRGRQSLLTEFVERIEGGDFFGFIESGEAHMRETFPDLDIIDIGGSKAWYVCRGERVGKQGEDVAAVERL